MKKILVMTCLCAVLACSGCENDSNAEKNMNDISKVYEEDTEYKNDTECENVQQLFNAITEDMLNACDADPSLESYWNDSLVFLNQYNNARLYGIGVDEQTAMLLYIDGEKVLIEYPFTNLYQELPKLNLYDIDSDGMDEVIISLRTVTGSIRKYAIWVCDHEDKWNVYMYDDYLQDIEDTIKYKYDDENNTIIFLDVHDNVLWKEELPEWTNIYPYTGVVNFEDNMGFDAETIQMDVVPQIELKDSLPLEPIRIIFNIGFANGDFEIVSYDIQDTKPEVYSTKEEIDALEIPEDMLAYWLVLNNKKPFISANEGCQEFFWEEYFWCLSEPDINPMCEVTHFGVVDLDNDGSEELVMTSCQATQVLDYQEGKVYSYQFVFRGMAGIRPNGVYGSSSAFDIGGFHRIAYFDKGAYEEETLAYMEHDYFKVEGAEVSEERFFEYVEPINKAELIKDMDLTEEMLDKILLGDLEEEKLSIVKHAKTEEICDENNPRKANVPEAYLAVLTGKEEFICVTEDGEKAKLIADGNRVKNSKGEEAYQILYFSMVDMEGDGADEVVLTCTGKNLILHAAEDSVYGYAFEFWNEMGMIDKDGVFRMGHVDENRHGKILSFETDGCQIEPVEDYDSGSHEKIRYYFFSEEKS